MYPTDTTILSYPLSSSVTDRPLRLGSSLVCQVTDLVSLNPELWIWTPWFQSPILFVPSEIICPRHFVCGHSMHTQCASRSKKSVRSGQGHADNILKVLIFCPPWVQRSLVRFKFSHQIANRKTKIENEGEKGECTTSKFVCVRPG